MKRLFRHAEPAATTLTPTAGHDGDRLQGVLEAPTGATAPTRTLAELLETKRFLRSTLDALASRLAIIDERGTIIEVNAAWQQFARDNNSQPSSYGVGGNYLTVCDPDCGVPDTQTVSHGIRAVITGQRESFELEYSGNNALEQCWYAMRVTRFADKAPGRVVVTHENITERKLMEIELARTRAKLTETARRAGQAEMATGILHNVGNVLTSINVATDCLTLRLQNSRSGNLTNLAAMLRAHETDLANFLTTNPKGRQIPAYLAQLDNQLTQEQATNLQDLAELQKSLDHLKEIVILQQSCAKMAGVSEKLSVPDLIETALKLNASHLRQGGINVVKEYEPLPLITAEKHQLLQILVNLLRNATQACDDSEGENKQLTLRASATSTHVRIAVMDNGVGIPPENLARLFTHGFTTKKEGHGFGLHSCALAAKELNGSLTAHSDGPGTGATFLLELPVAAPQQLL